MKTIEILSTDESEKIISWCNNQQLDLEIFAGKKTCRKQKWWGYEAEFYFNKQKLFERDPIESDNFLAELRDRFEPECDSILLYKYEIGGEIGEHLDKKCFDKWVTLINLIDDSRDLFGEKPATKFRWNRQNYNLRDGEVIKFDSRVIHSVPKVKSVRYSLQFRKIAF